MPNASTPTESTSSRDIWSVSRLNLEVRALLDSNFGHVWIEGEISNFAHPRSGHMYFSLKDSSCQVRCAMFKGQNRRLQFTPANGQQVLVRGRVGLYAERGDFQLVADYMEEGGVGALRRAFDALKARLGEEGLFDAERKSLIPAYPHQIGVLSSATGAALHDILTTLRRRFAATPVVVYPIPVQGSDAPAAIVNGLQVATARAECDVLIIARGGGSLEDLWAFNDEQVARAVVRCPIPIVSGVGHEVDFTIIDFVADARAATPTAAAEMVSPERDALALRVRALNHRLRRNTTQALAARQRDVQIATARLKHPNTRLQELTQRSDLLMLRLQRAVQNRLRALGQSSLQLHTTLQKHHPAARLAHLQLRALQAQTRLHSAANHSVQLRRANLDSLTRSLRNLGPVPTLARGYAIAQDATTGIVLRNTSDTAVGNRISIKLASGTLFCNVDETQS